MGSPPGSPRLWRPGCSTYPVVRQILDPVASKEELNQLYERMSESAFDLSLKDLVEPSYSISGEYTAGNYKETPRDSKKYGKNSAKQPWDTNTKKKGALIRRLLLNVSLCSVHETKHFPNSASSKGVSSSRGTPSESDFLDQTPCLSSVTVSPYKRFRSVFSKPESIIQDAGAPPLGNPCFCVAGRTNNKRDFDCHQPALSTSKVHPSNQCSACFSYMLFFKIRCLVCGKMYCSNCAKLVMDAVPEGHKCKITCVNRPVSRRYLEKASTHCLPSCAILKIRRILTKNVKGNCNGFFPG